MLVGGRMATRRLRAQNACGAEERDANRRGLMEDLQAAMAEYTGAGDERRAARIMLAARRVFGRPRNGNPVLTSERAQETAAGSPWDSAHIALTIGLVLAVTIVAFEGLALATVAPVISRDLGGQSLYGWIFSAFLLTQMVATVIAGQQVDRRSPALVFGIAMALFALGLTVGAAAPTMFILFIGRALQGLGAGAMMATNYAMINSAYDDRLRPGMFAAISTAWVVPSMIGPAVAGWIAQHLGWRAVFLCLLPLLGVIAPLLMPRFIQASRQRAVAENADTGGRRRMVESVALALGTGAFLAGLDLRPAWIGGVVAIAGLVVMVPMMRHLLPHGTFAARPVMPAAIAARGLFFGGYIVAETYMVLALNEFGGVSPAIAGLVLTVGSLSWTSGSWLQARLDARTGPPGRAHRVLGGVSLILIGVVLILGEIVLTHDISIIVALIGWLFAGLGIGLAHSTCATIAFAHTRPGQEGLVSSSILLGDLFGPAVAVGLGGVILAAGDAANWSDQRSIGLAIALGLATLVFSWLSALRLNLGYTPALAPAGDD